MRMFATTILAIALVSPVLAQPPRGGGRGMMGMMGGNLLANKSVQAELKLTEEQQTKLKAMNDKQAEARAGLRDLSQEERTEKMAQMRKETEAATKEILTPEQAKRLKEIQVQVAGVLNPETQKTLNFTDDQKEKLKELTDKMQKDMAELFTPGSPPSADSMKKMQALGKEVREEAAKLLTSEQKKQFDEMAGKPFDYKPEAPGAGRGGNGRPKPNPDK